MLSYVFCRKWPESDEFYTFSRSIRKRYTCSLYITKIVRKINAVYKKIHWKSCFDSFLMLPSVLWDWCRFMFFDDVSQISAYLAGSRKTLKRRTGESFQIEWWKQGDIYFALVGSERGTSERHWHGKRVQILTNWFKIL